MDVRVSARRQTVAALFIAAGLVAVSCSDHESPTSPGSPSSASKATISGTLLAASDSPSGRGGVAAGEPLANATVRVPSTGQSAQTDAAGRFTLADVAPGMVNLEIRAAGVTTTASVAAAAGVVTRVSVTVNRGRSTVKIDPRSDGTQGTVFSITGTSFVLKNERGMMIPIQTDANTIFRMRGTIVGFGDLKVGQKVEVEGSPQTDGSVLAARVNIENPEQEEATRTPNPTVTGTPPTAVPTRTPKPDDDDRTKTPTVTGTPPTGTPTRTPRPDDDDRTKTPTVTGTPPTGTPTRTPRPDDDDRTQTPRATRTPEDEGADLEGAVASAAGSSFVVMTKSGLVTIQTTASTQFRNDGNAAGITDVKMGVEVEVKGQVQADKTVLASRVDIKGD